CIPERGFEPEAPPARVEIGYGSPARSAEFWSAGFQRGEAGLTRRQSTLWSWKGAGRWKAPANPRLAFATERFLFKLYAVQGEPPSGVKVGSSPEPDSAVELLKLLLPDIDRCLSTATSDAVAPGRS